MNWFGRKKAQDAPAPPATEAALSPETLAIIMPPVPASDPALGLTFNTTGSPPEQQILFGWRGDVAQGKLAIKALKLRKKEYALLKKETTAEITKLHSNWRVHLANVHGTFAGVGMRQHNARLEYTNAVSLLERRRSNIDGVIRLLDDGILQIEAFLLQAAQPARNASRERDAEQGGSDAE
jgi:prefoldin subunit 5